MGLGRALGYALRAGIGARAGHLQGKREGRKEEQALRLAMQTADLARRRAASTEEYQKGSLAARARELDVREKSAGETARANRAREATAGRQATASETRAKASATRAAAGGTTPQWSHIAKKAGDLRATGIPAPIASIMARQEYGAQISQGEMDEYNDYIRNPDKYRKRTMAKPAGSTGPITLPKNPK